MSARKSTKAAPIRGRAAPKPKAHPKVDLKVDIVRLFHALGDPTRRAMLDRLTLGPQSVSALAEPLGITLTAVAQHLQVLEECALVHTKKLGRVRTCRMSQPDSTPWNSGLPDRRTIGNSD